MLLGLVQPQAGEPKTLEEQLARDNPKVITYLQSLKPEQKNKAVSGVRLSDGTMELKGYVFLGSRHIEAKKQHIFLFKGEGSYRAYAWIDQGGRRLSIPADKSDSAGENAYVLSGDIFTFAEMTPEDGLVVLAGANPAWLEKQ